MEIKPLVQYTSKISNLFWSYLHQEIDAKELIENLRKVEAYHLLHNETNEDEELWLYLNKETCIVTTINDLEADLSQGNKNRKFTEEQMKLGLELGNEIIVNFS